MPEPTIPPRTPRNGERHELALLFVLLCYGSLMDTALPAPPDRLPLRAAGQLAEHALDVTGGGAATFEPSAHTGWKSSPERSFG